MPQMRAKYAPVAVEQDVGKFVAMNLECPQPGARFGPRATGVPSFDCRRNAGGVSSELEVMPLTLPFDPALEAEYNQIRGTATR